jgi:uncharacterized protein
MILKILLVGAVIYAVYFMFFKQKPIQKKKEPKQSAKKFDADEMIECTNCGVYTEISECIISNGKYYCSKECVFEAQK